jgi:hypothetical protein
MLLFYFAFVLALVSWEVNPNPVILKTTLKTDSQRNKHCHVLWVNDNVKYICRIKGHDEECLFGWVEKHGYIMRKYPYFYVGTADGAPLGCPSVKGVFEEIEIALKSRGINVVKLSDISSYSLFRHYEPKEDSDLPNPNIRSTLYNALFLDSSALTSYYTSLGFHFSAEKGFLSRFKSDQTAKPQEAVDVIQSYTVGDYIKARPFMQEKLAGVDGDRTLRSYLRELKLLSPVAANDADKGKLMLLIEILEDIPKILEFETLTNYFMLKMEKNF